MSGSFSKHPIKYFDKKVGWILYPIIGISFIFFANDNDFTTLIQLPSFKWDVLFSIIAVVIVGFYLAWLVRYLDQNKNLNWDNNFSKRTIVQLIYGLFLPLFFIVGIEIIYLILINIPLDDSSIFKLELPLAFLYLFIINLLYYLNFVSFMKQTPQNELKKVSVNFITAQEGAKEKAIPLEDCAFIQSSDKMLWLHTFQNKQILIQGTLVEWNSKLPSAYFFRLNRQFIAHRDAIDSIEQTETRRLKVFLKNLEQEIFISKTNATSFRQWWKT